MICFSNPGRINPNVITLMGVNVKPGLTNPIGHFGTGLKYAIAVCLRLEQRISIETDELSYRFSLVDTDVRGKNFSVIHMQTFKRQGPNRELGVVPSISQPLGFTTELGKNWELWMAYRELWSNAQDENGLVFSCGKYEIPDLDSTRIYVEGAAFTEVHATRGKFLLDSEPYMSFPKFDIHAGQNQAFFYQNIKVHSRTEKPYKWTYNTKTKLTLSEDRTADSYWVNQCLVDQLSQNCSEDFLYELFTSPLFAEFDLPWNNVSSYLPEDGQFDRAVLKAFKRKGMDQLPDGLKAYLRRERFDKAMRYKPYSPSKLELKMLEKAKAFIENMGVKITFPIDFYEELGKNIYGLAKDEKIWIARGCFDLGTKFLAATLYEEYLHLEHGWADGSRDLQNFLFNKIFSQQEEILGEPL
jgi:hypothetical protein